MGIGVRVGLGVGVSVGLGIGVTVGDAVLVGMSVAVSVGVDVAVGTHVLVEVGVAVGSTSVAESSIATGVVVGAGPHAANNRRLRPMEILVSSTDLTVLCSYVFIALWSQIIERFSGCGSWGQADVPPLNPK